MSKQSRETGDTFRPSKKLLTEYEEEVRMTPAR